MDGLFWSGEKPASSQIPPNHLPLTPPFLPQKLFFPPASWDHKTNQGVPSALPGERDILHLGPSQFVIKSLLCAGPWLGVRDRADSCPQEAFVLQRRQIMAMLSR